MSEETILGTSPVRKIDGNPAAMMALTSLVIHLFDSEELVRIVEKLKDPKYKTNISLGLTFELDESQHHLQESK